MKNFLILFYFQVFLIGQYNFSQSQQNSKFVSLQKDFFLSLFEDNRSTKHTHYVLYDVNPVEGFNLRRDVYIRMSVFIKNLVKKSEFKNIKLVLPYFNRLYHWKSSNVKQNNLLWSNFFDIDDMKKYIDVIDFNEFTEEVNLINKTILIDEVFQLNHFVEMLKNGVFIDKFEFFNCSNENLHARTYLLHRDLKEKQFTCLRFQGSSKLLENLLLISSKKIQRFPKIFLILNAEVVLHANWGNKDFWQARRSMRFNKALVQIAKQYRKEYLNSTDSNDCVQRPENWMDEQNFRGAKGGPYICAHLRRSDFLQGRQESTPTLKSAAIQIKDKSKLLNISKVFISSDCSKFEFKNLKSYIGSKLNVFRFSLEAFNDIVDVKDGGIAIIDQIICSHARYFIGTYESTFTYRISEEREILGFPKETTFNTFCKNEDYSNCQTNSVWPIVY